MKSLMVQFCFTKSNFANMRQCLLLNEANSNHKMVSSKSTTSALLDWAVECFSVTLYLL